jgi:hypothetical protein
MVSRSCKTAGSLSERADSASRRETEASEPDSDAQLDRVALTRRGFIGAALAAIGSAIVIALLWLIARNAPSAGSDPALATASP